jgi:hypothetical protein
MRILRFNKTSQLKIKKKKMSKNKIMFVLNLTNFKKNNVKKHNQNHLFEILRTKIKQREK